MQNATTRDRLIQAMTRGLQRRGLHGVGLTELLAEAGTPKGVLYHHFPRGKDELAEHAIIATVQRICSGLERALSGGRAPWPALEAWMRSAESSLEASGFERGCPLATIALETAPDDVQLRNALATGFAQIRAHIAAGWQAYGTPPAQARSLAALVVASYEGGLIQARVAGNVEPLRQVRLALARLLDSA